MSITAHFVGSVLLIVVTRVTATVRPVIAILDTFVIIPAHVPEIELSQVRKNIVHMKPLSKRSILTSASRMDSPRRIVPESRASSTSDVVPVLDTNKSRLTVIRAVLEVARLAMRIEKVGS